MTISIIVSIQVCPDSPNHFGIGKGLELLHDLSDDKKNFKEVTKNKVVIMGRNTWESIPRQFRPLPNRKNVLISSTIQPEGVETYHDLDSALKALEDSGEHEEVFIMGGSRLYLEALPKTQRIYLTIVRADKEADIFFPKTDLKKEFPTLRKRVKLIDEKTGIPWEYLIIER
ncbi:MAG: dihydrofolate reductase [Candidatus Pacebacteria bacterium]|nr:dihydrofolate reductase [Candidatus Paceibacterota bacterium]